MNKILIVLKNEIITLLSRPIFLVDGGRYPAIRSADLRGGGRDQ